MLFRIMLLVLVIALTGGCETIKHRTAASRLEELSKEYNNMIRWREMNKAETMFPPEELRETFNQKVQENKNVTVTDFRVKKKSCFPEKGVAEVILDIDYYREPSITVKTVEYRQEWKYVDEKGDKVWRLMSPPPDFP